MDKRWFEQMEQRIPRGKTRTRFAPSPTGYMHVGNLRTALYAYLLAKRQDGAFILRIEDTDQGRYVEGAADAIFRTLREAGLRHDEGPDIGGPAGPYVQTQRKDIYEKYAALLLENGGAYRCFCQKQEHAEEIGGKKDACACRALDEAEAARRLLGNTPYVIRQKVPKAGSTTFTDQVYGQITVENETLDDNVLIKSGGLPTYNFANVVDDHLMGITHVVRGAEYLSSVPKYNLLYEAFGWAPPVYIHCAPVMRDAQNKMSKRRGDPSYEDLRALGYLPDAIVNYVALLGWSPGGERELFSLKELCGVFDVSGISKSPAIFDPEKLTYFNSAWLRAMSPAQFHETALPSIRQVIKNPAIDTGLVAALLQPRLERLTDIGEKVDFFETLPDYDATLFVHKKSKTDLDVSRHMLEAALPVLEALPAWTQDAVHGALLSLAQRLAVKNATLLWPVRIAAAGKAVTPGGAVEICAILGKEETLRRLRLGLEKLED